MPGASGPGNALSSNPILGTDVEGAGVTGQSNTGPGVLGQSLGYVPPSGPGKPIGEVGPASDGVRGESDGSFGVHGVTDGGSGHPAPKTAGVWGESASTNGVYGSSAGWNGVEGDSWSAAHAGVAGVNNAGSPGAGVYGNGYFGVRGEGPNGNGFIGGIDPQFNQKAGVYGSSDNQGVIGASTGGHGTAVYGNSTDGFAIRGETTTGTAIQGTAFNGGYAAQFSGNVRVTNGGVAGSGTIEVSGDMQLTNSDCAEDFDVMMGERVDPGTVMVLSNDGTVAPSRKPYDCCVAGIVSGAGDLKPAILLGRRISLRPRATIALAGTVYCKVDATEGSIEVGDLLTTSALEGHAMKVRDRHRAFGAVLGKAMRGLDSGRGLIPVLIALQ
jgi:hypothetical protein